MNELATLVAVLAALVAGLLAFLVLRGRAAAHRPIVSSRAKAVSQPSDAPCSAPGCQEQPTWACGYRNPTRERCGSHWCRKHVTMVGTATYCTRHAGVSKTLNQTEGSIYEVKSQPSLEDRALSLLDLIRQNVDPRLRSLLAGAAVGLPGVEVSGQKSIQEIQSGSERIGWQVSWGLYTSRGYLLRALIRVGVPEPPVVRAVVANEVVFQSVPYWITRRLNGEPPNAADHQRFYADLIGAMREAVLRGVTEASAQLEFESEKFGSQKSARY